MSDTPTLNLKPRRPANAQSAAGAYGVVQARAVPGQTIRAAAPTAAPAAVPQKSSRGFIASNWPLMGAAAALLAGGVVMGMAVGSAPPPKPALAVAAVAPLPVPAASGSVAGPAAGPAATVTVTEQGWRPIGTLTERPALAPPPAPANPLPLEQAEAPAPPVPVAEAPAVPPVAQIPAQSSAQPLVSAPAPSAPIAAKAPPVAPRQADKAVQLAAAPMAPPAMARPMPVVPGTPQAWRARAVAPPATAKPPYVAIIIDDAGLDKRGTQRAIRLPGPVTLSFMSYAAELSEQSAAARAAGHEVMLHLPMEPLDTKRNNPGPNALYIGLDEAELQRRLVWHLDRFSDYVGVNNHMGSRFTANAAGMSRVIDELNRRQVYWLDSLSGPSSAGPSLARQRGVDAAERDLFLDDQRSPGIAHELAAMERIARARGDVIAIGHPHATTLAALEAWIAGARDKGFSLVPVSTVLLRRQQQER